MGYMSNFFGGGFNTNSVPPQSDYDVLPPGKYLVQIDKSEVKQTKKGNGHYLEIAMTVFDGQYRNRKLWDRINIQNPSQQCTDIGLRQLSALGRAVGIALVTSEDQFLSKTCIAHVKVKDEQNEIRTYSPITPDNQCQSAPLATPPGSFTPQQPQTNTTFPCDTKPPWAR